MKEEKTACVFFWIPGLNWLGTLGKWKRLITSDVKSPKLQIHLRDWRKSIAKHMYRFSSRSRFVFAKFVRLAKAKCEMNFKTFYSNCNSTNYAVIERSLRVSPTLTGAKLNSPVLRDLSILPKNSPMTRLALVRKAQKDKTRVQSRLTWKWYPFEPCERAYNAPGQGSNSGRPIRGLVR